MYACGTGLELDYRLTTGVDRRGRDIIADKRAGESLILATQAHVDAMAEAEAKAKLTAEAQKQSEAVDVVRLIAEMRNKDQAITLIRAMAAHFGYTLVDMKLPKRIAA